MYLVVEGFNLGKLVKMISINDFNKAFIERHDFEYDDLNILSLKYPGVMFSNIPEAWVILIDSFLAKAKNSKIKSISQTMGFLIVDGVSESDMKFLKYLEDKIVQLDIDLHDNINEGIVLH
jgi:hypothetical protein